MRIIYMGNNERGIACLKALAKSKHEVVYAVAQTGGEGWYSSIDNAAKDLQIPCSIVDNPNEDSFLERMGELSLDLVVMCGYSKIVGKKFRSIPKKGCINLHASKLPNYRGAAPLNWALINGEREIGLSIYFVDGGIDTGPIIVQEVIGVGEGDTINDVLKKTLEIYPKMLLEVCDMIEKGTVKAKEQNLDEGTYFTKRRPKDGEIKWDSMTDEDVYNLVRALTNPYPGAFFSYGGKKVFVWGARLEKKNFHGIPGRVATRRGGGVVVVAKNRGIRITRIQLEGKDEDDAKEVFKVGEDLI